MSNTSPTRYANSSNDRNLSMSVFARTADAGYVYDPKWEQETARLLANQAIWDRGTIERLDRLGVTDGWTCLEIGAGCGSIARRLVELTGSGGRVMATDLVTERLEWLRAHGVEVRRHDVTADELPDRAFDLIHARMVMQHLPDRETVVTRLRNALRPGGWLYLEDTDPSPAFRAAAEDPALAVVVPAGYQVMREAGFDDRGGQADVEVMLRCGLEDVSADGRVELVQGGSTQSRNYVLWLDC